MSAKTPSEQSTAIGVEVRNDNVDKALEVLNRRVLKSKRMLHHKQNQHFTPPTKVRKIEKENKERNAKLSAADQQPWKREEHLQDL